MSDQEIYKPPTSKSKSASGPPGKPRRQGWQNFLREATPTRELGWYLAPYACGAWLEAAFHLPGRTPLVAMALQHQASLQDQADPAPTRLTLGHKIREQFGISSHVYERGLDALRNAGLVDWEARCGRLKQITLLGRFAKKDRHGRWHQYVDGREVRGMTIEGKPIWPGDANKETQKTLAESLSEAVHGNTGGESEVSLHDN